MQGRFLYDIDLLDHLGNELISFQRGSKKQMKSVSTRKYRP